MTVWFTSDLHLGHLKVSQHRGFQTTDSHDRTIVNNWSVMVRPIDQVWVLGDLAMYSPTYALDTLKRLPGTKHLIAGNHDGCHSMHKEAHLNQKHYLEVFDSVQIAAKRKIAGQEVLLSHFPYTGDHTERIRYTQWRLKDEGLALLHGHMHSATKVSGRQIDVGLDSWNMRPVSLDQLVPVLQQIGRDWGTA